MNALSPCLQTVFRSICHCLHLLLLSLQVHAQEYSYLHYDARDGLPSSVVHGISQDRDGFIWFATEAGLSRFDGKHFRNFTRADGLPGNEVFSTFADSRNRIWITCFKNAVCYYYKGRIHNRQNDPILSRIRLRGKIDGYAETETGDIVITVNQTSYIIPCNNSRPVKEVSFEQQMSPAFPQVRLCRNSYGPYVYSPMVLPPELREILLRNKTGISTIGSVMNASGDQRPLYTIKNMDSFIIYGNASQDVIRGFPHVNIRICHLLTDSTAMLLPSVPAGVIIFNIKSGDTLARYMPELKIHYYFQDREGNQWLSTNGQGVYQLCNPSFVTYIFEKAGQPCSVLNISKQGSIFHVMTTYDSHWQMAASQHKTSPYPLEKPRYYIPSIKQLLSLAKSPIAYSDMPFHTMFHLKEPRCVTKSLQAFGDTLLLASSSGAYRLHLPDLRITDTLYPLRATRAIMSGNTFYIGTADGLYIVRAGKTSYMGAKFPSLRNQVNAFACATDGTLWIATDSGIAGFKNNVVTTHISQAAHGLASDMCLSLFADGRFLWAGTAAGLHKIDLSRNNPAVVARYDVTDGLRSDIINAVYTEGPLVYAGTSLGLTCFDERKVPRSGPCDILLTAIRVSGREIPDTAYAGLNLSHENNNIRFEYAGISFRSAGHIRYRYRLQGLQKTWQTTTETLLDYPSLPSGSYTLQIQAINKFGIASKTLEQHFIIGKTFWEYPLVQLSALLLLIMAIVLLTQVRQSRLRKTEKEKQEIRQKMLDLEQAAMRAQMNPHFIFNCLNSIQNFILDQDARGANFYLIRFAGMVRQTLQNVSRKNISLEEEISYLSDYLDLERLQTEDRFRYTIHTGDNLPLADIMLPVMILQPFVENAVKHGVARLGKEGSIDISFTANGKMLECIITDNGPGISGKNREQPRASNHTSMGLSVTRDRIALLNQLSGPGKQITLHTGWAFGGGTQCYGTKITLQFPL